MKLFTDASFINYKPCLKSVCNLYFTWSFTFSNVIPTCIRHKPLAWAVKYLGGPPNDFGSSYMHAFAKYGLKTKSLDCCKQRRNVSIVAT